MKLKNGVSVRMRFYPGYGSPATWEFRVIYDNRVLEKRSCTSEFVSGQLDVKLRAKWRKVSATELKKLASDKELAFSICEACGRPCKDGVVCKGVTRKVASERNRKGLNSNPIWCLKCDKMDSGVLGALKEGTSVRTASELREVQVLGPYLKPYARRLGATGKILRIGPTHKWPGADEPYEVDHGDGVIGLYEPSEFEIQNA